MLRLALSIDGGAAGFPRLTEIAAWLEALALHAWIPGRSRAPPTDRVVADLLPGVACAAVRHLFAPLAPASGAELLGRDLAAKDAAARARSIDELVATARWALAAKSSWVIVEPPSGEPFPTTSDERVASRERDARLDRLCRTLHEAAQREPLAGFALATPREPQPWLTPATYDSLFEELGTRRRFAYWHDAGRAHALAASGHGAASTWLDRHAPRCVGLDATDAVGAEAGLPAGAGEVDFPQLLGAVGGACWISLRSEPFSGAGPLLAAARHLRGDDR